MAFVIDKITKDNYPLFDDMVFWRENGVEREPKNTSVSTKIVKELSNPDLFIYAAKVDKRYVGWISLIYMPKVGKWQGSGHIYIDELWVAPEFRRQGLGKELMNKADELQQELSATGIRLYVNTENPGAEALYKLCGFQNSGKAYFMEK
jgi:ribosomal protein S18 acetylase RimI-like enzyme